MAPALAAWLVCTIAGALLIDRDEGPSFVSLTSGHGLSLTDIAGATLLLAGWATAVLAARRRPGRAVPASVRRPSAAALLASGAGLLTAAVLLPDFAGRKVIVGGLVLLVEWTAAAAILARR